MESKEPIGYSYLGPAGTFTESALKQIPEAVGQPWRSVNNVIDALLDVSEGRSYGAVIAIENSVDGGVTAVQDALATIPDLRIIGEYLVPVQFVLAARPGTTFDQVRTVAAHPVAYGQSLKWFSQVLPGHTQLPASSNVAAVSELLLGGHADAAVTAPGVLDHYPVELLAENIGDSAGAVTRFVLVTKPGTLPQRTGADKTTVVAELPEDRAGALLELLEQFSTRGVNLSLIQSRPVGDVFGRYRFVMDIDGHILDERIADALLGLKRFSPKVVFLGSYPRADGQQIVVHPSYEDAVFVEARDWLRGIISGEPNTDWL